MSIAIDSVMATKRAEADGQFDLFGSFDDDAADDANVRQTLDERETIRTMRSEGSSVDVDSGAETRLGSVMGTPAYMPPEQAIDAKNVDCRADIYSLGATLYFLLTGRPVYLGETLAHKLFAHREDPIPSVCAARPDAPPSLDAVFQKMVAKTCEERYQSMTEVIEALQKEMEKSDEEKEQEQQQQSKDSPPPPAGAGHP